MSTKHLKTQVQIIIGGAHFIVTDLQGQASGLVVKMPVKTACPVWKYLDPCLLLLPPPAPVNVDPGRQKGTVQGV